MTEFTMSLETEPGKSHVHGFHLGTIERVAREIAQDKMRCCRENNWPMVTIALIRDRKIFDTLYRDGKWHNADYHFSPTSSPSNQKMYNK